ncbi:hypothetical protein D3C72_1633820 [compost metagenome]
MTTREIPREDWGRFLGVLSNRKADHPVRVRVEGTEIGDQMLADCMPMVGISLEQKGSEADAIALTLSFSGGESNLTHEISCPEKLYIKEDERGEPQVLDIEDRERVKTLVFFDAWTELPNPST